MNSLKETKWRVPSQGGKLLYVLWTILWKKHDELTAEEPELVLWHQKQGWRHMYEAKKPLCSGLPLHSISPPFCFPCDHVNVKYLWWASSLIAQQCHTLSLADKQTKKQHTSTCGKWERWKRSWERGRRGPDRQTPSLVVTRTVRRRKTNRREKTFAYAMQLQTYQSAHVV